MAEYAIALAFKANQRVVYTSPLKVSIPTIHKTDTARMVLQTWTSYGVHVARAGA